MCDSVRTETGTSATVRSGASSPRYSLSISATAVSSTSFTVAPVAAAHPLHVVEPPAAEREQAVAADLLVEPRRRRRGANAREVADELHSLADAPVRLARVE